MWIDLLHELNEVSLAEIVHLHRYPSLEVKLGAFTQRHPDHPMAALANAIIAGEARWLGMPRRRTIRSRRPSSGSALNYLPATKRFSAWPMASS